MTSRKLTRRDCLQWLGLTGSVALLTGCGSGQPTSTSPQSAGPRRSYGSDPRQFGELQLPAGSGPHPVLIVIHGGFWRSQYSLRHIAPLCPALTSPGWATWDIVVRLIRNTGGRLPRPLHGAAAAAAQLLLVPP